MNLAKPPSAYDVNDQAQTRRAIQTADSQTRKIGENIDMRDAKLFLTASDGSRWQVVVSPSGVLSTVAS